MKDEPERSRKEACRATFGKAHVDQSFKPVDSIKCVKFKKISLKWSEASKEQIHQNAARLIQPVQCSKLEMGEEGRSETANRQPGLLHWLEVLHREVLDQAERTSCMVAPPQLRIER